MSNSLFVIVLLFGCTFGLKHQHTGLCGGMWDGIDCTAIVCGSYHCYNGGKCVVTGDNKPSCHCQQGFHGDHCRIKDTVSPCDSNPCQNEGICLNFGTSFTCSCKYGWSGTTCQNSINLCDCNPCQNGGTCLNLGVSFSCACADGWAGESCEKDALPKCHDICAIEAVARSHSVFHNSSEKCSNSNTASNEAMVMVCCGLDRQHTWLRGVQVMSQCRDSGLSLSNTPIASFHNGRPVDDTAGVFFNCDENGFRYVRQSCNATPSIFDVDGSGLDPGSFYVIY